MNFTREPIIETIITPKDGNKLVVRNSKSVQEEYSVDAVEVVSFGHSFFFRSSERPKCFLLPVGDYEVIEMKETRVVLKNAPLERSVKIGGGRQPQRVVKENEDGEEPSASHAEQQHPSHDDKMKRRKGMRRRRGPDDRQEHREASPPRAELIPPPPIEKDSLNAELSLAKTHSGHEETQPVVSSMFRSLFPPPTQLISDNIARYKPQEPLQEDTQRGAFSDEVKKHPKLAEAPFKDTSESEHFSEEEEKKTGPKYHQAKNEQDDQGDDSSPLKTHDLGADGIF